MQTAARGREGDLLVGRSLEGRYRILERIADGGMSTVYAAVDERLDRYVAVKVMSTALSADPNFSDRFAREARAAARLTHLNVVSVYDQGHDRGPDGHHVFLVMELVEGRTLRDLIRERGRLSAAEAVSIMEPVLSALAAAHRAGIVHRDVKPENILLSDDGIVKVADFGLARAAETDASSTRTGLMMGTVAYCAPETISSGVADPRSDVYAAGVVLFELLTGTPPFTGETAVKVAYQHVHNRVPAPSSRVRDLPEQLDELVVEATDSDPAGRPADAGELLASVADVRSELRLPVVPVPRRERPVGGPARPERPQRRGADEMTTGLIAAGASGRHDTSVVPDGTPGRHERPDRTRGDDGTPPPPVVISPDSARRRRRRRAWIIVAIVVLIGALAAAFGVWLATSYFQYVPRVTGESRAQAIQQIKNAGYDAAVEPGPVSSETVPKGDVVSMDPSPGSRLTSGNTVTITLSAGPRMYRVPDVARKTEQQARAALAAVGDLDVAQNVRPQYSETVDANLIIGTSPAAGSMVSSKTPIILFISQGPPRVDVPSIDPNTSVDDARQTFEDAGLKGDFGTQAFDDTVDKGNVVSCQPDSGQQPKGSTITCIVSKGPAMVDVPAIADGTPDGQIRATMKAAGLKVRIQHLQSFPIITPDPGSVKQSPAAGTSVDAGSTVVVGVYS